MAGSKIRKLHDLGSADPVNRARLARENARIALANLRGALAALDAALTEDEQSQPGGDA